MGDARDDHERIWLQNAKDADTQGDGRLWCQDKVWPHDPGDGEPTEYVRADLATNYNAGRRVIAELRRAGYELSNVAFNLSQVPQLTPGQSLFLADAYKKWDAAIRALPLEG